MKRGLSLLKKNNLKIINKSYAEKTYYLTGKLAQKYPNDVKFSSKGFPNFRPYAKKIVTVDNTTGNSAMDIRKANKKAGYSKTPSGFTWHHCEDGVTMMLIPTDLHKAVSHTVGAALLRSGIVK